MCLAIPGKIQSIEMMHDGTLRMAKVSFGGIIKEVSLEMVSEAEVDDYVLVHVGVAISIVNETEANKVYDYLKFAGELNDLDDQPVKG
ncbi:MAG: HypC/HybG/HupF family hydrogenase formation chaperone [Ginsengibacter sp.]